MKFKHILHYFIVTVLLSCTDNTDKFTKGEKFEMINLVNVISPDNLKKFDINEEYTNKTYTQTSGIMRWAQGGGSVLYFTGQGKNISAKWLDSQTLEITHDKDIVFSKKEKSIYFAGDDVKVIYKVD
jgi:hypothetical protein